MKKYFILALLIGGLTSCATKKQSSNPISKADMIAKWSVETLNTLDNLPGNQTLNLNLENNTIQGNGGCNNFSGNIERDNFKISFSKLISTQMMCPNADAETAYLKALENTHSFKIKGNKLSFFDKSKKEIIVFTKLSR